MEEFIDREVLSEKKDREFLIESDKDLILNEEGEYDTEWINYPYEYKDEHGDSVIYFGNRIVGIWFCKNGHKFFPRKLEEIFDNLPEIEIPFKCPECGLILEYDEEA